MTQVRRLRAWQLATVGFLLGLLLFVPLTAWSAREYRDPALNLLNSGAGLSALIAVGATRVLIVSGDDPSSFENAFNQARPDLLRRIDLVILTPSATESLVDRAVAVANPRRLYALPHQRFQNGNNVAGHTVRPMDGDATITLENVMRLEIDSGFGRGWSMTLNINDVTVQLSERISPSTGRDAAFVVVMGDEIGPSVRSARIPVVGAIDSAAIELSETAKQQVLLIEQHAFRRILLGQPLIPIQR